MTTDQPASFLAEFKNLAWPKTQAIPQSLRNRDLAFLRVLLTVKRCLEHRVPDIKVHQNVNFSPSSPTRGVPVERILPKLALLNAVFGLPRTV
jgi:hypothetical protein